VDQLNQVENIIRMRKTAMEFRRNALGEAGSLDKMDEALDPEQEVIDSTEEMDHSP
jgi:hypothetical protein